MGRPRPPFTPLAVQIARHLREPEPEGARVAILPHPVRVSFFVPGRPKAKARGMPQTNANGKAYTTTDPKVKEREKYIRECFLEHMLNHPGLVPYFPCYEASVFLEICSLMEPSSNWFPGKPHVGPPDQDNLVKLVKDALSGRASGRPAIAFKDDSMVTGFCCAKPYWHPDAGTPEPGTYISMTCTPLPRDPSLLPPGAFVCPKCKRDDWKSEAGGKAHVAKCKG